MNILHLDSSILGPNSISRDLSAAAVAKIRDAHSGATVVYHDLVAEPVPHLTSTFFAAMNMPPEQRSDAMNQDLAIGNQVLEQFMSADILVIGVAFYNFTIASQLKTWIDRIVMPGKTFTYQDGRPVGLANGKRVILTISRGGFYEDGTPAAGLEHCESYLTGTLGFLGIDRIDTIIAPGVRAGPDQRAAAIAAAQSQIQSLEV